MFQTIIKKSTFYTDVLQYIRTQKWSDLSQKIDPNDVSDPTIIGPNTHICWQALPYESPLVPVKIWYPPSPIFTHAFFLNNTRQIYALLMCKLLFWEEEKTGCIAKCELTITLYILNYNKVNSMNHIECSLFIWSTFASPKHCHRETYFLDPLTPAKNSCGH